MPDKRCLQPVWSRWRTHLLNRDGLVVSFSTLLTTAWRSFHRDFDGMWYQSHPLKASWPLFSSLHPGPSPLYINWSTLFHLCWLDPKQTLHIKTEVVVLKPLWAWTSLEAENVLAGERTMSGKTGLLLLFFLDLLGELKGSVPKSENKGIICPKNFRLSTVKRLINLTR